MLVSQNIDTHLFQGDLNMFITNEMRNWLNSQSIQDLRDALRADIGDLAQVIRDELNLRTA
jgi:hypothetical protein